MKVKYLSISKSSIQYLKILENPVSQNIRISPKIDQKKDLQNKFFKVCSFMLSILCRGSFSTNDSIRESKN